MADFETATSKNPLVDEKPLSIYTKAYWFKEFQGLSDVIVSSGRKVSECLSEVDPFYDSRKGVYELSNVTRGLANFEKTVKAVETLRAYAQTYDLIPFKVK